MNSVNLLKEWMKYAHINISELQENGRLCTFVTENSMQINIETPSYCNDIFIVIDLTDLGRGDIKRERLELAMKLNSFALETRGGVIGWNKETNRLNISYRIDADNTNKIQLDSIIANLILVSEDIQPLLQLKEKSIKISDINNNLEHLHSLEPSM